MSADQLPPFYESIGKHTMGHAVNVLTLMCGDRFSTSCDRVIVIGSNVCNMLLKILSGILALIIRAAVMLVKLSLRLICSGELKTTCDAVGTVGLKTLDITKNICWHIFAFFCNKIRPSTLQAIQVARNLLRQYVAPTIYRGIDLMKERWEETFFIVANGIAVFHDESVNWMQTTYDEILSNFRDTLHYLPTMTMPTTHDLFENLSTMYHRSLHSVIVSTAAIFTALLLMKVRSGQKNTIELNNKQRSRSFDAHTHSGFLDLDEDLEEDDDINTIFTNRRKILNYLEQECPAAFLENTKDEGKDTGDFFVTLPLVRGPAVTTLTFRAYTPPSIDKEIPKVDVIGTLKFIKTGKVRTFVPLGSRRLLVVNFQDMTVELYLPKPSMLIHGSHAIRPNRKDKTHQTKKKNRSGIHLSSTKNLMNMDDVESDESEDEEEDENAWNRTNFQSKPKVIIMLSELISVSAIHQSQSSLLEIVYRLQRSKGENIALNQKTYNNKSGPPNSDDAILKSGFGRDSLAHGSLYRNVENANATKSMVKRRKEFTFLSPCDAANFQRIVMALRISGQDIFQLYEMLEEIHVNTEAYFPVPMEKNLKNLENVNEEKEFDEAPMFYPPGVALDDAWRCMNEIPSLRNGLLQYQQHSYHKFAAKTSDTATDGSKKDDSTDDKTNYKQKIAEFYRTRRALIGIVDFVMLFVHPLPSEAVPYVTPCGASDMSGIDLHKKRLQGSLLLQEMISRTSVFVLAYCRAKFIIQDGWYLNPKALSPGDYSVQCTDDTKEKNVNNDNWEVNPRRLAFDNDRDNWNYDVIHQNNCYEGTVGKDVCVMLQRGKDSPYQGFTLVGMHVIRLPFAVSSGKNTEDAWLDPSLDPVQHLPSLRGVIEKYYDRQFLVVFFFNKPASYVVCHLFVRSLPIGVDVDFDEGVRDFMMNASKQKKSKIQVSFQFAFDQKWSSLKRIAIRKTLSILFRWFFDKQTVLLNKGLRERLSCPPVLARNFAQIRHFPRLPISQRGLKNYASITVEDSGGWKYWLIKCFSSTLKNIFGEGLVYDFSLLIEDDRCKRALATARVVHMNSQSIAMPFDFRENHINFKSIEMVDVLADKSSVVSSNCRRKKDELSKANALTDSSSDEIYSNEIDAIFDILEGVKVPKRSLSNDAEVITQNELVRFQLSRADIERYLLSCACDIQATTVRLIESSSWRGRMFPIDLEKCRIELRSGQFFQQGFDRETHPIFYFRHLMKGPWNNMEASIMAILYRLEAYFQKMALLNPNIKVTVIILMTGNSAGKQEPKNCEKESGACNKTSSLDADPMMDSTDNYTTHGSEEMFTRLIGILRQHYPERLSKALIIPGGKWNKVKIREYITAQQIATPRVMVLKNLAELRRYVSSSQLVTVAGGTAPILPEAFSVH